MKPRKDPLGHFAPLLEQINYEQTRLDRINTRRGGWFRAGALVVLIVVCIVAFRGV